MILELHGPASESFFGFILSPFKFTVYKLLKVRWGKLSNLLTPASGDSYFVSVIVPFAVLAACDASFTFMCILHQRH